MGEGTRKIFLKWLPRLLFMRRPNESEDSLRQVDSGKHKKGILIVLDLNRCLGDKVVMNYHEHRVSRDLTHRAGRHSIGQTNPRIQDIYNSPSVLKSFENICFIAELLKKKDRDDKVHFSRRDRHQLLPLNVAFNLK